MIDCAFRLGIDGCRMPSSAGVVAAFGHCSGTTPNVTA